MSVIDNSAIVFAVGALVLNGVYELTYRFAHRKGMNENSYMLIQTGAVFVCLLLLSGGGIGFDLNMPLFFLGIFSGIIGVITGWSYLYAMGRGPLAVTSAIRKLGFIVTALLAVLLLHEELSAQRLIALSVACVALIVMGWSSQAAHRPHPMVFVTLFSAGLMTFLHKVVAVSGVSVTAFLMVQAGTAHLSSHVLCMKRDGYQISRRILGFALLSGIIIAAMMTLGMYALMHGDAVVIAPILQLGFLVTAPFSFLLFRETITWQKVFGIVVGALAIVLFARGS